MLSAHLRRMCTMLLLDWIFCICCCSVTQSCLTLWDPMDCSMPGFPVLHYLPELAQTHVHWVSDATQLLSFLLLLPSIFPIIRVFSNDLALCISWPKYWNFGINTSNEYSGLTSVRTDWSPCSPKDSQESSSTPQFNSINSLAFSLFDSPTLTSIHYWRNNSFDFTDLCWQCLCFLICCLALA